jgi:hypothetical protein
MKMRGILHFSPLSTPITSECRVRNRNTSYTWWEWGKACGGEVATRQMGERKAVFILSVTKMFCCFEIEVMEAVMFWARMGETRSS